MNNIRKLSVVFSLLFVFGLLTAAIPLAVPSNQLMMSPAAGDTWTTPLNMTLVNNESSPSFDDRSIAVDAQGNIHIAYVGFSDNENLSMEIYYVTNTGGSWSWTNVSKMNTPNLSTDPVIAVDSNGVAHIVWTAWTAGGLDLFYSNNSGGTWQTPYNITGTGSTTGIAVLGAMTIDSSNTIHIAYVNGFLASSPLAYITFNSASGWSTPVNITNIFDNPGQKKSIVVSPSGQVFIAYSAYNTSLANSEVYLINKTGSTWGTPVNITQNMADSIQDQSPSMSIDRIGNIHLIWESKNGSDWGLKYSVYSSGSWSTPIYLNATTDQFALSSITTDINNKAHVAFSQNNGSQYDIYYTNNTMASFGAPVNITKSGANEQDPHIILDQTGYAHIVFGNTSTPSFVQYVKSTEAVALPPPADVLIMIIIGVVVAVVVVAGAAVYLLRIRKPK